VTVRRGQTLHTCNVSTMNRSDVEDAPIHDETPVSRAPAMAVPKGPRKPIAALDSRGRKLIQLMVFGFDDPEEAARYGLPAHTPLTLEQASEPAGLKRRNARYLFSQRAFLAAYSENLAALRKSHQARAVATLAEIADDPGDGTAATKTARIKASNSLLDDQGGRGTNVNVNVGVGVQQITAGIVLRLPAGIAAPPLEQQAEAIEHYPKMRVVNCPETSQQICAPGEDEGGDDDL
jgi:hypothetical protein